jgi:predicted nuclease with TOPRIM domain
METSPVTRELARLEEEEFTKLLTDISFLSEDVRELTEDNDRLRSENEELTEDNDRLRSENKKLTEENSRLEMMAVTLSAQTVYLEDHIDHLNMANERQAKEIIRLADERNPKFLGEPTGDFTCPTCLETNHRHKVCFVQCSHGLCAACYLRLPCSVCPLCRASIDAFDISPVSE